MPWPSKVTPIPCTIGSMPGILDFRPSECFSNLPVDLTKEPIFLATTASASSTFTLYATSMLLEPIVIAPDLAHFSFHCLVPKSGSLVESA